MHRAFETTGSWPVKVLRTLFGKVFGRAESSVTRATTLPKLSSVSRWKPKRLPEPKAWPAATSGHHTRKTRDSRPPAVRYAKKAAA